MHLIESYATSSGLKIDKPFIYEKIFPVPFEKYISFQPFSKYTSKDYDYWNEVVSIIYPFLQKENIHIVQIGGANDKPIDKCINFCGKTKISHAAFIIKNALMHVGTDSFAAHVASGYDKKIVALYSNNNINNVKPYWTKEEDMILLEPERNNKPSYAAEENPKSINKIKPENVAKSILKLLNIKENINHKTVYTGPKYQHIILETIPEQILHPQAFEKQLLNVRFDLLNREYEEKDYNGLIQNLNTRECCIVTNKPLILEPLLKFKNNIKMLIYDVTHSIDVNFIEKLTFLGINNTCIFKIDESSAEELNNRKEQIIDLPQIIEQINLPKVDIDLSSDNLYYRTNKLFIANNQLFLGKQAYLNNTPIEGNNFQKISNINLDEFIKNDLEYAFIFEKN